MRDEMKTSAETERDQEDIKQYSNMITSLEYTVSWLESGREPGAKRGLDRREVYKRMVYMDEELLSIVGEEHVMDDEPAQLSAYDLELIEDALSVLPSREKDIFLMNKVELLSYERIAGLLGLKKGTVQTYVKKAQRKLINHKKEKLFFVN